MGMGEVGRNDREHSASHAARADEHEYQADFDAARLRSGPRRRKPRFHTASLGVIGRRSRHSP